jgi:thiamine kinase-like enzyme
VTPGADVQALVARLEPELGSAEGEPLSLEGGITNRNYRVRFGGSDYVVRCPSKNTLALGIDRESERAATEAAARIGAAPQVAAFLADEGCLVTEFLTGEPLTAQEVRRPDTTAAVARTLREIHAGPPLPVAFEPLQIAAAYRATVLGLGREMPDGYEEAQARMQLVADAVAEHPEHAPVPCHNDLLAANLFRFGERVRIIDWEYAGMGDRFFDLANLAVNCEFGGPDEERLLTDYFGAPPTQRRLAAVRLMKLMSDFREALWGAVQDALSPGGGPGGFDYAGYARKHLDRLAMNAADARFPEWLEEART